MKNKSMFKMVLIVFGLILASSYAAYAQKTDCSKKTDNEIIIMVYEKIKAKYPDQLNNINITLNNGTITLNGKVSSKKIKKEVEKLAKSTDCVKKVVNNLTVGKAGGCGPGMKECGNTCISEKETCNICLIDPSSRGCN